MAACLVWVLGDGHQLRVVGTHGFPDGYKGALEGIARSGVALASMQALEERRVLVFPDSRTLLLRDAGFAPLHHLLADAPWDTLVCLPLIFHDAPLGTLVAHFQGSASPDEAALSFLGAIADQAAVAVENARLVAAQAAEALEERRQAQTLAQQRETQSRAIFEATSDGMVIRDPDGRAVEMNQAYCAMHGYSREEMLKLPPSSHVHPDYRGSFADFLETIRRGGTYRAQAIDVRQDGTPFHVDVRGTPITYQGKPHVLGIVRDITEQVEAYRLLEERVEERTRELSMVLEVSHDMASTLDLQPLLGLILTHLRAVVDYFDANIMLLDGDELCFLDYWGPLPSEHMIGRRFPVQNAPANRAVIEGRVPVIIPDIWDDSNPLAQSFRQVGEQDLDNSHRPLTAWMGVPLIHKERVIGMLGLSHTVAGYFTDRHARLALAIANHAAEAMENARLYSRAQQVAALEERARLARELHDSVSQALYGIALGAQTARSLLARDPSKVAEPLDYVLSLAEAGLTEMRALIFALRPESLATEGLVAALEHQVAALRSRYELRVDASLGREPEAAYDVKEALYRIAQEALHNTVKHARARRVRVSLKEIKGRLALSVEDDGAGFDTGEEFRGHLGLRSMRERAESLGGRLTVESSPEMGTRLRVWVPSQGQRG
jgi:PAS domain S-box-containing protein